MFIVKYRATSRSKPYIVFQSDDQDKAEMYVTYANRLRSKLEVRVGAMYFIEECT